MGWFEIQTFSAAVCNVIGIIKWYEMSDPAWTYYNSLMESLIMDIEICILYNNFVMILCTHVLCWICCKLLKVDKSPCISVSDIDVLCLKLWKSREMLECSKKKFNEALCLQVTWSQMELSCPHFSINIL